MLRNEFAEITLLEQELRNCVPALIDLDSLLQVGIRNGEFNPEVFGWRDLWPSWAEELASQMTSGYHGVWSAWNSMTPIVSDSPVRFNNHTEVSYTACLVQVCIEIGVLCEWLLLSDRNDQSVCTEFVGAVKSAIFEANGIENIPRSESVRPIEVLFTAAVTEIHREMRLRKPPSEVTVDEQAKPVYSRFRSPKEWRAILGGISPATWTRWMKEGVLTPSDDSTSKAVRLPLSTLPAGYVDR